SQRTPGLAHSGGCHEVATGLPPHQAFRAMRGSEHVAEAVPRRKPRTVSCLYSRAMPKICHVCAKGPAFGNNRSHSMVATRRRFDPNLQRVRIDDGGTPRRVYVCTRCLKAGKITKAR